MQAVKESKYKDHYYCAMHNDYNYAHFIMCLYNSADYHT